MTSLRRLQGIYEGFPDVVGEGWLDTRQREHLVARAFAGRVGRDVLGLLGVAVGIPLGYAIARANLAAISATLTSIYVLEAVDALVLPPAVALLGAAAGLIGAVLGALPPAWDMSRRDPLQLLAPILTDPTPVGPARLQAYLAVGHVLLHAASTMKVPVLIEAFRRVDRGELALEDAWPLDRKSVV